MKVFGKILFLVLLLVFRIDLIAQDSLVDSLKLALKNARQDSIRIKLLSQLSEMCEVAQIPEYAKPCIEIAEHNIPLAKTKALKNFFLKYQASAINNMGFLENQHGDINKALYYFKKALEIQKQIGDTIGVAASLNNIGAMYKYQGRVSEALDYYHRALKLREAIQDKSGIAYSLNNIGHIYHNQGDSKKALEYYRRSLSIQKQLNDKEGEALCLHNIGSVYDKSNRLKEALNYYQMSLEIREQIKDIHGVASTLNNIGAVLKDLGDYENAEKKLQRARIASEESGDKPELASAFYSLSDLMIKKKLLKRANDYALQCMQIAQAIGYPEKIRNAAHALKKIYELQGNYKEALRMFEIEVKMRDSLANEETKKASIKRQFQYQYEKQAAADSVKNAEEQKVKNAQLRSQRAQLKQEQTRRYALYGGLLLVIAFSGFVYNRFKITHRQKVIIEKQKKDVLEAYGQLHEKNKEITDSIIYARRIQRALITSEKYIGKELTRLMAKNKRRE